MRRLLEGGAISVWILKGVALIRRPRLFDPRRLLVERWYCCVPFATDKHSTQQKRLEKLVITYEAIPFPLT